MSIDLTGQVALVAGGTGGWGRAACFGLAERGAAVLVNARDPSRIDALVQDIRGRGGRAAGYAGSITTLDVARQAVAAAIDAFGRVDVMVNCAGGQRSRPLLESPPEEWTEVIDVELNGAYACAKAAAEHMVERGGGGALITVAGGAGIYGLVGGSGHAAAKGGVIAASWSWAQELRPYGISVNCLRGGVRSEAMRSAVTNLQSLVDGDEGDLGFFLPEEASPAIVWLASREAREVTGYYFGIDGPRVSIWEPKAPDTEIWSIPSWAPDQLAEVMGPIVARRAPMMKVGDLLVTRVGRVEFSGDRW